MGKLVGPGGFLYFHFHDEMQIFNRQAEMHEMKLLHWSVLEQTNTDALCGHECQ